MSTIKQIVGAFSSLTVTGLSTLASATYVASNAIDNTTSDPLDIMLMVEVTPGTVASNKQVLVFAQGSHDGTDWQTGPTSGTTATDEPNLTFVGAIPCNTNSTQQRAILSVAGAFGGVLPPHLRFVFKNETGAALTAAAVEYAEVSGEVA